MNLDDRLYQLQRRGLTLSYVVTALLVVSVILEWVR